MAGLIRRIGKKLGAYWPDRNSRAFARHNRRCFSACSRPVADGGPVVLFELKDAHSAQIAYSYLANVLAKKYGAGIAAYIPIGVESLRRKLEWQVARALSLGSFATYRSFGASRFFMPRLDAAQEERAARLAEQIAGRLTCKSDIESIAVDGVWLGDLIYDTYLRLFNKPTIDLQSREFRNYLDTALGLYVFWDDYFNSHDVRAVNVSHTCYVLAMPLRIAVSRGIPAFQINATHVYRLSSERLFSYSDFYDHREVFRRLPPEVQRAGREESKKRIEQRFSGKVGVDMGYSAKSAYGAHREERLLQVSPRTKVLIATHCFFDSPHGHGKNLFPDYYEWMDFLGRMTLETDYDWYIKTHPDYLPGTKEVVDAFVDKYPKFHLLPADASHHQIIAEGLDVALTTVGSIGFEYAALGIPVVTASVNNPYIAYDFNVHPRSVEEYRETILNLDRIDLHINKDDVYEYYFMRNLHNTDNWLFEDFKRMEEEVGGYFEQFTPKVYGVWMRQWTPAKHEEVLKTLETFVDSGAYRLGTGTHNGSFTGDDIDETSVARDAMACEA